MEVDTGCRWAVESELKRMCLNGGWKVEHLVPVGEDTLRTRLREIQEGSIKKRTYAWRLERTVQGSGKGTLIPMSGNNHWRLLYIEPWAGKVHIFDSYGPNGQNEELIQYVGRALRLEVGTQFPRAIQKDGYNCGIYIIMAARGLAEAKGEFLQLEDKMVGGRKTVGWGHNVMEIEGYIPEERNEVNEAICQALRHNFRKLIRLNQDRELATHTEELRGEKIAEGWEGRKIGSEDEQLEEALCYADTTTKKTKRKAQVTPEETSKKKKKKEKKTGKAQVPPQETPVAVEFIAASSSGISAYFLYIYIYI